MALFRTVMFAFQVRSNLSINHIWASGETENINELLYSIRLFLMGRFLT
jgi:hypothetical protein